MRSVTVRLDDLRTMILNLGYVGENEHRTFNFDCKKMFGEYPSASVSLTVQPPAGDCYLATVERNGDLVSWTVTDSDLIEEGCGEIQLTFMVGEVVAKTCIGRTKVERSLGATGDIPTPIENWIEQAEEVISEAQAATAAAEDAAEHQPIIDDNGYWNTWDADQGAYVSTGVKAQGEDGEPGQDGTDATPALITVDYSNLTFPVAEGKLCYHEGLLYKANQPIQSSEAWTAAHWTQTTIEAEQSSLLTEINSKQDAPETAGTAGQVLGLDNSLKPAWVDKYSKPVGGIPSSDMTDAVQTSLGKADSAYQKPSGGIPGTDLADTYIKEPVTYADLIYIQNLLDIYQAPWELIRGDTVTNATETDVEITVDGDGNAFELTDVYLQVGTPQQETAASIGDYGTVRSYYDSSNYITSQMNTWSQAANAAARFGQVLLENKNGAILNIVTQNATQYSSVNLVGRTNMPNSDALMKIGTFAFNKIVIKKVTGTVTYKLYGKRKWTA